MEFAKLFNCKSFQSIWKDLDLKIYKFKGNIINQKTSQKNKQIDRKQNNYYNHCEHKTQINDH